MDFGSLADFQQACSQSARVGQPPVRVDDPRLLNRVQRIVNFDQGFWGKLFQGRRANRMTAPYKEHPWVFAVLTSRYRNFSQAPWTIGRENDDGTVEAITNHPLVDLFARPNRLMSGRMLWQFTRLWLDLLGECFWVLGRDNVSQVPRFIQPWPGGSIWTPGPLGADEMPVGWVLTKRNGRRVKISSDQVVYFRTPNPQNPLRGCPPLSAATTTLNSDVSADDYMFSFFENDATPGGFISYPQGMDDDEWETIERRWNDKHQGRGKAHRLGVLEEGAKFTPNNITNKDIEYLNLRKWNKDIVNSQFGWNDVMLGLMNEIAFANAVQAKRQAWEEVIIPEQDTEAEVVDAQLLRFIEDGNLVGFFDRSKVPALRQAEEQKWATALTMRKVGISLQEINRKLDLDLKEQDGWRISWASAGEVPVGEAGIAAAGTPSAAPGMEAPRPTPSDVPRDDETDDERPDTGSDSSGSPIEQDAALLQVLRDDRAHLAVCQAEHGARIALLTDRKQQDADRERRQRWTIWDGSVLEPAERRMLRGLRPYFRAIAIDQTSRFERVARRSTAEIPGVRTRIVTAADIPRVLFDRDVWDPRLRTIMRDSMNAAMDLSGAFTTQQLSGMVGPQVIGVDLNSPAVQRLLDSRVRLVEGINTRLQSSIAQQLATGIRLGETTQELRGRIEGITSRWTDPVRSLRIARTEQGTVTNALRFQMLDAALDFHIWIHAGDELVRNTHFLAEATSTGNPVRVGQPFSNGLLHPLDPGGPPGEVINCRCLSEPVPTIEVAGRAMTADEMRDAFFAGCDAIVERWSHIDVDAYCAALLDLDDTKPPLRFGVDRLLVPCGANGNGHAH